MRTPSRAWASFMMEMTPVVYRTCQPEGLLTLKPKISSLKTGMPWQGVWGGGDPVASRLTILISATADPGTRGEKTNRTTVPPMTITTANIPKTPHRNEFIDAPFGMDIPHLAQPLFPQR